MPQTPQFILDAQAKAERTGKPVLEVLAEQALQDLINAPDPAETAAQFERLQEMLGDNGGRSDNVIPFQCKQLVPTTWHEGAFRAPGAQVGAGGKMTGCVIEGNVGQECQIWRGAHVMFNATLGDNCMLGGNVLLNSGAIVGNNVRVQQCSAISGTCVIHDNVSISACVNFCNVRDGKSRNKMEMIVVEEGVSIGANVSIVGPVVIGAGATIGAGAVVTHDVPPGETWVGNPARNVRC